MSGALLRLAEAARRLDATPSPAERDHLLVRCCCFFFGTFLYKGNEFTFSANIIFLPDLWAEGAVRRMIDAVLAPVPLDQPQEAILHKCFSDIALLQRDPSARKHVAVGARKLFELETLLNDRALTIRAEHRQLQEVYDAVRDRFLACDFIDGVQKINHAMKAIMEHEFTVMFQDFYKHEKGRRRRPTTLQEFDEIVRDPTWTEVRAILDEVDNSQKAASRSLTRAASIRSSNA